MLYEDDFIRIQFKVGNLDIPASEVATDWPPPERVKYKGHDLIRINHSHITDDERAQMTHMCRGALYQLEESDVHSELH